MLSFEWFEGKCKRKKIEKKRKYKETKEYIQNQKIIFTYLTFLSQH